MYKPRDGFDPSAMQAVHFHSRCCQVGVWQLVFVHFISCGVVDIPGKYNDLSEQCYVITMYALLQD